LKGQHSPPSFDYNPYYDSANQFTFQGIDDNDQVISLNLLEDDHKQDPQSLRIEKYQENTLNGSSVEHSFKTAIGGI
jgi:hypothetical protein